MGKTHEALERAEEEYRENILGAVRETEPKKVEPPPRQTSNKADIEWYEGLKTNLLSRYPNGAIRTILFNGTAHGGGCSTTAINFATTLAKDSKLNVLLIDVNLRTPGLHDAFKIDKADGLTDLLSNRAKMVCQIKQVERGNLHVVTCGGSSLFGPVGLFESSEFDQFLKGAREKFDYVILDAPPVPIFSECRILCTKVDGVILVLEAGRTRRQVAIRAKRTLEEAGAKLLGVVINKRKLYIPEWIYKRL
jgi:capsular exopolysaccharide synthesis family protein